MDHPLPKFELGDLLSYSWQRWGGAIASRGHGQVLSIYTVNGKHLYILSNNFTKIPEEELRLLMKRDGLT